MYITSQIRKRINLMQADTIGLLWEIPLSSPIYSYYVKFHELTYIRWMISCSIIRPQLYMVRTPWIVFQTHAVYLSYFALEAQACLVHVFCVFRLSSYVLYSYYTVVCNIVLIWTFLYEMTGLYNTLPTTEIFGSDHLITIWVVAYPGSVFCLLFGVNSGYARPITGQVTSVTWHVIDWA